MDFREPIMGQLGLCSLALVTLLGVVSQVPSSTSLAVMSVDLGSEWLKIAIVKVSVVCQDKRQQHLEHYKWKQKLPLHFSYF